MRLSNSEIEQRWRLASASLVKSKASWAHMQTSELGRKRTIISVDADEALVIYWALEEYIDDKYKRLGRDQATYTGARCDDQRTGD